MELRERDAALAVLAEYEVSARAGDGRLASSRGRPAPARPPCSRRSGPGLTDVRWLWGACDGSFTPEPLQPFFDLDEQFGGMLDAACRAGAPREHLFLLAKLGVASRREAARKAMTTPA